MKEAFCLFHCSGNRCHAATSARSEEAYHASFDPEEIAGSVDEERSAKESLLAFAEHRREECALRRARYPVGPDHLTIYLLKCRVCARSEEAYHASLSRRRSPVRIRSGAPRNTTHAERYGSYFFMCRHR